MSFLSNIYFKSLAENEKNIRFWEEYLNNLKAVDFNVYQDKLKVPALVPIGSRMFFRGEIKHTNEVTAALGAGYFAKCSLKQAEVLRQHRIKDAQSKLNTFLKEKEFLENQLSFKNQNLLEDKEQEIIELCTEEEDKIWREKHRENLRKYKQSQHKNEENDKTDVTDEELWNRLEELELQEELENELDCDNDNDDNSSNDSFIVKDEESIESQNRIKNDTDNVSYIKESNNEKTYNKTTDNYNNNKHGTAEANRLALLEKILNKQNELEDKLFELKNKERSSVKTEEDLISKLDEMEQLEELEDEMERIEDIIEESEETVLEEDTSSKVKLKRRVSFADEQDDEPETLELTFTHSDVEPCKEPHDPKKGITKPSDVYEAFAHLFKNETTSILKKTMSKETTPPPKVRTKLNNKEVIETVDEDAIETPNRTIIVNDVVDRSIVNNVPEVKKTENKPQSLFKRKRQLMKSK